MYSGNRKINILVSFSAALVVFALSADEALSKTATTQTPKEKQMATLFKKGNFNILNTNQKTAAKRWFALGKPNFSGNAAAGSLRLVTLKYGNFTRVQLGVASRLVALKQKNFTKQQLLAAERLNQIGRVNFTLAELKAGVRMIALKQNKFTLPQAKASTRLINLGKGNFTLPEVKIAQRLAATGLPNFTNSQFLQSKRLVALGQNNYTQTQLKASAALYLLGHPNFTGPNLIAAEQLIKLGHLNFNAARFAAAEDCVARGINNFTEYNLQSAIVKGAWATSTPDQKLFGILDVILEDQLARTRNALPAAKHEQTAIKNMLTQLIGSGDVVLPVFPAAPGNLILQYNAVLNRVSKANAFIKYERDYHCTRQEAREFYAFHTDFLQILKKFGVAEEKRIDFFRGMQRYIVHNAGPNRAEMKQVLRIVMKNSLPIDYTEWPTVVRNDTSFNNFFWNVLLPVYNAVRGSANLKVDTKRHVAGELTRRAAVFQARLNQKIADSRNANNAHQQLQFRDHGTKQPLNGAETFQQLTVRLEQGLTNMDNVASLNAALRERINFSQYCKDPFMGLLRAPDQRLNIILNGDLRNRVAYPAFGVISDEVQALKNMIFANYPTALRPFDYEFNSSFASAGFGLDQNNGKCIKAVARLKRLYECVANTFGQARAAEVLYHFGAENDGRCIDGKRDRITELERQYVYVAGGLDASTDPDATIGLNFAKLFMDHRTKTLRDAIDALFNPGESRTYAWFRSHRALTLGFGLTGEYEEIAYGAHTEQVDPLDFIQKYFRGGNVIATGSNGTVYNLPGFGINQMVDLVRDEIRKPMGGLFDDNTLNYMINSNLAIRRAYTDFQADQGNAAFDNEYFRDASTTLRNAIKPAAIKKVLHKYGYTFERDLLNVWH